MEVILKMWQSLSSWLHYFTFGGVITVLFAWIGKILGVWEYFSKKNLGKKVKSSAVFRLKHTANKIHEFNSSLKNLMGQPYGPEHQKRNYPDWLQPKWTEIFALDKSQIDLEQAKKDLELLNSNGSPANGLSKWRSIFLKQRELMQILIKTEEQTSSAYKKLDEHNSKRMNLGSGFGSRSSQIGLLGQTGVTELEESTRKLIERNASILTETEHGNVNLQSKSTD